MARLSAGFLKDPESEIIISVQNSSHPWTVYTTSFIATVVLPLTILREVMSNKMLLLDERRVAHIQEHLPLAISEWIGGQGNSADGPSHSNG